MSLFYTLIVPFLVSFFSITEGTWITDCEVQDACADACNYTDSPVYVNQDCLEKVANLSDWSDLQGDNCDTVFLKPGDYTGLGNLEYSDLNSNTVVLYGLTYPMGSGTTSAVRILSFNDPDFTDSKLEFVNIIFEEGVSIAAQPTSSFGWFNDSDITFNCCLFEDYGFSSTDDPQKAQAPDIGFFSCYFDACDVGIAFGNGYVKNCIFDACGVGIDLYAAHPASYDAVGHTVELDSLVFIGDESEAVNYAVIDNSEYYGYYDENENWVDADNISYTELTNSSFIDIEKGVTLDAGVAHEFNYYFYHLWFLPLNVTPSTYGAIDHPELTWSGFGTKSSTISGCRFVDFSNVAPNNLSCDYPDSQINMSSSLFEYCGSGVYNWVSCTGNYHRNSSSNCNSSAYPSSYTFWYPTNTNVKNSAKTSYTIN